VGDTGAILSQALCNFSLFREVFQVPLIVYPSTFVVTWQQIPRPIRTATLCLMVFEFLAYLLRCPLQRVYAPVAEVSVFEELEIATHLVFFVSADCVC
jgi:hypothetical protein